MKTFNYYRQFLKCTGTRTAVRSERGEHFICQRWGGTCRLTKCENNHRNNLPAITKGDTNV